jgi:hypothetical protein
MKYKFLLTLLSVCSFISCCSDQTLDPSDTKGKNMAELGFLPTNTAAENVKVLQNALDEFKVVYVDQPGVYDLDETIYLSSNTKITFGENVYVRKVKDQNGQGAEYVFINRGAYAHTYDENIEINGLNLICNGLDDGGDIQGLIGQVSFFFVKHLSIKDFMCVDLLSSRFCIQVAAFEDILIEDVNIKGNKDGIHLGVGKGFVIRGGVFATMDDPIALNAHDYDISNPMVGWIEDCYDLPYIDKGSMFCRILAGSWVDWYAGMKLQKSDIVVNNGRLYRVIADPDGKAYTSFTAPTHTNGCQIVDGINWYMMQEGAIYNVGCRNIQFKNIHLKRDRSLVFVFHYDQDNWSRSYYPNSIPSVQSNFTFENIYVDAKIDLLILAGTPVDNMQFCNSSWPVGGIHLDVIKEPLTYPPSKIVLDNIRFSQDGTYVTSNNRQTTLEVRNSVSDNKEYRLHLHGNVTVSSSDIPYYNYND